MKREPCRIIGSGFRVLPFVSVEVHDHMYTRKDLRILKVDFRGLLILEHLFAYEMTRKTL